MTFLLRDLSPRARVLSLNCSLFVALALVRLARLRRASRPRPRPGRSRYAYSGFRRFACLLMAAVMVVQFALFPPEVSHAAVKAVSAKATNYGHDAHLWWHASGWAARAERFLWENFPKFGAAAQQRNWDGKGAPRRAVPKPEPQETQEERNGRVTRVEISPREVTIAAGQEIHFIAVAYDAQNSPVGGVPFDWDNENEDTGERAPVEERGKFSSADGRFSPAKEGNYLVKARFGTFEASAKVKVKGVRRSSGQQPIGTRTVSSRDLPQQSRSSLSPPATKDRIAKKTSGRFVTRYSSAGTMAMPRLRPVLVDEFAWTDDNFSTADDPGKLRGNPPGHSPDGGAGSSNFQFAAPVLSLDGRGQDLNIGLSYNSRVWHKANSEITFDIDHEWPGPGWSMGFGKIVGMGTQNGYMIIEPDGTRRPYICSITFHAVTQEAACKTTDGSFIDYKVIGDSPALGGAPQDAFVYLPNGTEVFYAYPANNAVYAAGFGDRNGNGIGVSYRNNHGPQIDRITDTLGRVVQFYYDSNNLPVAITGPGLNGSTRTLMRITYEWKNLLADLGGSYGFSGVTPKVLNNVIPVVKAIYYPANNTGYWFGDVGSYSAYGMLAKVIEQRGMSFSGAQLPPDPDLPADPGTITPGLMSRQIVYDYQMAASGLTKEPYYLNTYETWASMDGEAVRTRYFVDENAAPRRVEITRPDEVKTVMLSHNAPGQWNDGLIYQDETYSPQGALLGKSFVQWEQGECPPPGQAAGPYQYCSPRPSRLETTDERGQRTGEEFSYGPRYNQVTETREYGYGYVFGGANTLLLRTVNQYLNDPDYNDPLPQYPFIWHHIHNLVTVNEVYAGDGTRLSHTKYFYDQFKGTAGLMDTPGLITGYDIGMSPYLNQPNYTLYKLDTRGNVTTIKRYADAATLNEATAVVETLHYDITGNVRKEETACCLQTTSNYTLSTQYAWPESQVSGAPSDANNRNTTSATYDFNTGLVLTSTDANGRPSQTEYSPDTLRPVYEYSPTGAYQYHMYDDLNLSVADFVYESGPSGDNVASRIDKNLDGLGRVIKEIAYGKDYVKDVVETMFDNLGRVWKRTRPYRANSDGSPAETLQWSTVTYDSLDRPIQTVSPDGSVVTSSYNQSDPPGASGQPGQTVKATDPWGRERWARSDALGHLVEAAEPNPGGDGTLSSGALFTTYSYDAFGRLTQVNQGVQTRSFRYDSLGRLTHQKLAERDATLNDAGTWVGGGQWSDVFFYDQRSNLTQRVDARGVKTLFIYNNDPLNRLQAVQYDKSGSPSQLSVNIPVAPNVSYAYMTTGDKMRVQNVYVDQGMGSETMSYDSEGRLSQVVQTFTGRESYPLITNYIWDTLDRLIENTYPMQYGAGDVRKKVEPAYDMASRMDSVKFGGVTYASNPVYNASSQTTSLNIGSQIVESYIYDPKSGLMTGQQVKRGAETLVDLKYNYTRENDSTNNGAKTGQLTGITDIKNQVRNRAYEYDKLGRLAKVKGGANAFTNPNWHQTYSYDRYGNRTLVELSHLGMAPVNPGSQSKSDLIGKIGASDAANRILSAGQPSAALGHNKGYSSIAAYPSDIDNTGTPMRGGPRVIEEEPGSAPSANGAGGELRAERPAGAAPRAPQKEEGRSGRSIVTLTPLSGSVVSSTVNRSPDPGHGNVPSANGAGGKLFAERPTGVPPRAPEKKYGYRGARSLSPVAAQNVVPVYPSAYQTPALGGDLAITPASNTGHAETSVWADSSGTPEQLKSCRWYAFQPVSGPITRITLKFDWSATGNVSTNVPDSFGYASSSASFYIWYSPDNGSTATYAVSMAESSSVSGQGGESRPFGDSGSFSVDLPAYTQINQILVTDRLNASASAGGTGSSGASVNATISNIKLEVEIDNIAPGISNVVAGGITTTGATISWNTNENADTQVEYGTTASYGQSTSINPSLVTAHSQSLSGLTNGTLYHYRVKSKDLAGNLTVSGDFTFTTLDTVAPVISNVAAGGVTTSGATITWTTNENSNSQVEYGTTTSYGQSTTLNTTLVTSHSQGLSGLTSGTTYHYRVKSRDAAGNLATSGDNTFTTVDNAPPVISGVAAGGITATSATITWTTNEHSDSQVEYGTTTSYGQSTTQLTWSAQSQSLGHIIGRADNNGWSANMSQDPPGFLQFGPYTTQVAAGAHTAVWNLMIDNNNADNQPIVHLDVFDFDAGTILAERDVTRSEWTSTFQYQPFSLPFVTTGAQTGHRLEFRVYWYQRAYIREQNVSVDQALVTAHSQDLSGLTAGTVYHYRVKSRDASGNLAVSGDFTFTTADITAPVISEVAAGSVTDTGATITWTTNENSDSQVEYGPTTSYGQSTTLNPSLVTAHLQVLSDLTPGTVYHYRVKSRDTSGNLVVSGDFTFTTTQGVSIPPDGLANLSYNAANNRINTQFFEYDPAGNQTRAVINSSGAQQQYRYDCAGRLAQVLDASGNVLATHAYGAGNQRLMSVEGGVTKYFAWAGGTIIAEYEALGANALVWKTSYVYLGGRLLATTSGINGTETRFHHPGHLGPRLVTDAAGTVVSEQFTLPFGNMQPFSSVYGGGNPYQNPGLSNPSKKRFTSYDRSDVTGLHYAVNRSYSSEQGRFTQVDPIEMGATRLDDPQSLNLYSYCGNDPINYVDPDGLFFKKLFGWISKAFKWIAIAAIVAVAVLTIAPGAFAGTLLAKIGIWSIKHPILSALIGLKTPQWAIINLAKSAGGAAAAGFWAMAGVGAVNDFMTGFKDKKSRSRAKPATAVAASKATFTFAEDDFDRKWKEKTEREAREQKLRDCIGAAWKARGAAREAFRGSRPRPKDILLPSFDDIGSGGLGAIGGYALGQTGKAILGGFGLGILANIGWRVSKEAAQDLWNDHTTRQHYYSKEAECHNRYGYFSPRPPERIFR